MSRHSCVVAYFVVVQVFTQLSIYFMSDAQEPSCASPPVNTPGAAVRAPAKTTGTFYNPDGLGVPSADTIFVEIASYRDPQCADTIKDLYERAKYPRAVFVGVAEQHDLDDGDVSCVPPELSGVSCQKTEGFCAGDNIRVRHVPSILARGPTYGRFLGMLLYRGEAYVMMIDSHTLFVQDFDSTVVRIYKSMPPRTVFSYHPPQYTIDNETGKATAPPLETGIITHVDYNGQGIPVMGGYRISVQPRPLLQAFIAAGFVFANATMIQEVPMDPYLDYIFEGEEILHAVRLWTHGWDIYNVNITLCFHNYGREGAKRYHEHEDANRELIEASARRRIHYLLQTRELNTTTLMVTREDLERDPLASREISKYGLGTARSLDEYYEFSTLDPVHHVMTNRNKFLANAV